MAEQFSFGVDGAISIGGKVISSINSWTMNINTGLVDTPNIGSSGPVRTYTKYKDMTGTLAGQYKFVTPTTGTDTLAVQETITMQFVKTGTPASVAAKFVESSKSMYYGTIKFSNISKGQSADGLQSWSADWAIDNGPLAHTTSTST